MAEKVLTSAGLLVEGLDIACQASSVEMSYNQEILDRTCIEDTSRNRHPGLFDGSFNATLFWDSDVDSTLATGVQIDGDAFNEMGSTKAVVMVGDAGFSTGNVVYFSRMVLESVGIPATVGELVMQNLSFAGKYKIIQGESGYYSTAVTDASTEGPGVSLGAATSSQALYAAISVNTTQAVTVLVTSSTAAGDFSLSTTRLTFTATSTRDALLAAVSGAITDTAYRFETSTTAAGNYVLAGAFSVE
jgi:hypothetical protein